MILSQPLENALYNLQVVTVKRAHYLLLLLLKTKTKLVSDFGFSLELQQLAEKVLNNQIQGGIRRHYLVAAGWPSKWAS